ncbi:hypothetical protein EVAR_98737_1 [Eumeta japonica]|uniref:Uncharacterized protein n=1 Tax=Eumeta variegata TaxID=151549 RepID=A0A4C1YYW8_EUMVA|nr:hypothetical protein EVAR_98737_1 [Eumeta japonica]
MCQPKTLLFGVDEDAAGDRFSIGKRQRRDYAMSDFRSLTNRQMPGEMVTDIVGGNHRSSTTRRDSRPRVSRANFKFSRGFENGTILRPGALFGDNGTGISSEKCSHIYQGVRSVKTTDRCALNRQYDMQSCTGQYVKGSLKLYQ